VVFDHGRCKRRDFFHKVKGSYPVNGVFGHWKNFDNICFDIGGGPWEERAK